MNLFLNWLASVALMLPAFLLVLSFHECAHAGMAFLLGDTTAKRQGRFTLNPLAHVDWMGLLFLLVFRIGWAKPVPFDQRNFKHPRLYSVLTALAGPFSNFILTLLMFLLLRYIPTALFSQSVALTIAQFLYIVAYISTMLGVFNLLPIPPLDGSHLLTVLVLDRYPRVIMWFHRYSMFILLLLIYLPDTRNLFLFLIKATESFIKGLVF
jgi:Zn-dependent protease